MLDLHVFNSKCQKLANKERERERERERFSDDDQISCL